MLPASCAAEKLALGSRAPWQSLAVVVGDGRRCVLLANVAQSPV